MTTAVKSTSKNYARTYIMSELEKKITTSKTDQLPQSKSNTEVNKIPENSSSKIPIKPRPPQLASRPAPPRPASVNCKKPLIPQRAPNTIYSKPKQPPVPPPLATSTKAETDNKPSNASKDEKSSVQHLARKFSALGRNKTQRDQTTDSPSQQVVRKISDPTGLTSSQLMKEKSSSEQDDIKKRKQSVCYNSFRLATVSEEDQAKPVKKKHSHIMKSASTEASQLFPPQILISETAAIKHGSQDSGIADCSNDSAAPVNNNLLTAPSSQPENVPLQAHKHEGYLQVEYQKPTDSTIEAFNIHMMEEAPAIDTSKPPAKAAGAAVYGSQTDDEKVQYMYYSGSQESSCTVNSTDTDGYSLMKCPNYKRLSTDTYVEINNLMLPKPDRIPINDNQQRNCRSHTMDNIRVEPGYLPANRPESIGYVDHNCNPVKREDYCGDQSTADYPWNSTATLPCPKSPRKMSVIKDANGYVHEENLPPVEATALRRLIRHGNRLVNGELYSYAKVPGIILPTVNKDEPKPAWGAEVKKKRSVLKRPPPIQPKSDSMRRSIMQHRYTDDCDANGMNSSEDDNSPVQECPCHNDDRIGHSPNGFSSLDGPVFIDKFKTLETYGRDRSFSEFRTLSSPEHQQRKMTMGDYVSHDLVSNHLCAKNKAKKHKKPYKLPANVTSSYVTIGAPADYEVPYNSSSGGEEVIQHTSPPPSPPKPIPAPRKQLLTPAGIIERSPRDRSKSLHDFTDSSFDMDSDWRPIRERARLVSRRRHKALLKRTFSSENLLEHNKRKELKHLDKSYGWKRCETIDTTDGLTEGYSSSTEGELEVSGESILEHSESSLSSPESSIVTKSCHLPTRRVPLNDSIAKRKVNRSHSQEDLANVSPTITGYDIPRFRTKKPYVNLPPVVTANVEIGPVSFTMTTDNIYDTPRVPSTPADTSNLPQGGEAECMYASGMFTHKGGMLTSSGSGVQIEIPEGAIARGKTQQVWFAVCQEIEGFSMDTVDSRIQSNSRMFEQGRNRIEVTPRVLVGPTNVTFLKPIKIIIPHCVSPLHASWEFTALVRKEGTEQTDWQEVTQQILNPLWSKKPHRRNTYQHTKYQMMLREVMFSTLHPGWFVLTGEAVRNGQRTAKIMTAVVYCSKQEFENKNKKLTLFVLLANNTIDDRKVMYYY